MLSLVAVTTLPWTETGLVFFLGFGVALLDCLAGAYSVCIIWLRARLPKHKCPLSSLPSPSRI